MFLVKVKNKLIKGINEYGGITAILKYEIPELSEVNEDIINVNDMQEEKLIDTVIINLNKRVLTMKKSYLY
jgi:hypothetical protein